MKKDVWRSKSLEKPMVLPDINLSIVLAHKTQQDIYLIFCDLDICGLYDENTMKTNN